MHMICGFLDCWMNHKPGWLPCLIGLANIYTLQLCLLSKCQNQNLRNVKGYGVTSVRYCLGLVHVLSITIVPKQQIYAQAWTPRSSGNILEVNKKYPCCSYSSLSNWHTNDIRNSLLAFLSSAVWCLNGNTFLFAMLHAHWCRRDYWGHLVMCTRDVSCRTTSLKGNKTNELWLT